MKIADIKKRYATAPIAAFPRSAKLLLICVNRTIKQVARNELRLLDAVRYSWKISADQAREAEYVLAVAYGLILDVFVAEEWKEATKENFPDIPEDHGNWGKSKGRFGFQGHEASDDIRNLYRCKRVPDEFRNHGAPIRYVNM